MFHEEKNKMKINRAVFFRRSYRDRVVNDRGLLMIWIRRVDCSISFIIFVQHWERRRKTNKSAMKKKTTNENEIFFFFVRPKKQTKEVIEKTDE